MSFYTEMQDMADELLEEFGYSETVTLTQVELEDVDSDEPGNPITTDYKVKAVIQLRYLDSVEDNTIIDENRRGVILSTIMPDGRKLPVEPKTGFKLTFDGHTWTVDSGAAISPGGVPIIYKLEIVR